MTTYYVGPGGSDSNSGLDWANRKLTLNGAEDVPVVAGDTVYIGPGVYRELLTMDVNGGSLTPITYIGDQLGENTDGVGGVIRVTGSDDDLIPLRLKCVTGAKNYRTFQGIRFDMAVDAVVDLVGCLSPILAYCSVLDGSNVGVSLPVVAGSDPTLEQCIIESNRLFNVYTSSPVQVNTGGLILNCIVRSGQEGIHLERTDSIFIRNCLVADMDVGIYVPFSMLGDSISVEQSIIANNGIGVSGTVLTDILEDGNNFWHNATDRSVVDIGAASISVCPLFQMPVLAPTFKLPSPQRGELSEWSSLKQQSILTADAGVDLFGMARPALDDKHSWGPVQFHDISQDFTTTHDSSPAALKLADDGKVQFVIPALPVSTTIDVYVYREASYAGATLPQMVIRQPGQTPIVVTDTGAAATWNGLSHTFTPDASSDFVVVELVSNNEAIAGNYAVYFDDLVVT